MRHISLVFYFEWFKNHNSLCWQRFREHFQQNTRRNRVLINKKKYNICREKEWRANSTIFSFLSYVRSGKSSNTRRKSKNYLRRRKTAPMILETQTIAFRGRSWALSLGYFQIENSHIDEYSEIARAPRRDSPWGLNADTSALFSDPWPYRCTHFPLIKAQL